MPEAALDEKSAIAPLVHVHFKVPGSDLSFSAACFEGKDWSLAGLQTAPDALKHAEYANRLLRALKGIGACCAYAPNPTQFNARIIEPSRLNNFIQLDKDKKVYVRRNKEMPADGTFLRHAQEAGIFSAGGCGVIVMTCGDKLVFAHAGRDCLLDRTWVSTEGARRSRNNVSVVHSMLDAIDLWKNDPAEVHVWTLFFIKPDDFVHRADDKERDHPVYNPAAMRFLPKMYGKACGVVTKEEIRMNLPDIAKAQCLSYGVPAENIHMEHRFLADELPTTRNGGGRYLVAVVRQS